MFDVTCVWSSELFGHVFVSAGGSMHQILQVMNNRMHMNFSSPFSMGFMRRCRRTHASSWVKVNLLLYLLMNCGCVILCNLCVILEHPNFRSSVGLDIVLCYLILIFTRKFWGNYLFCDPINKNFCNRSLFIQCLCWTTYPLSFYNSHIHGIEVDILFFFPGNIRMILKSWENLKAMDPENWSLKQGEDHAVAIAFQTSFTFYLGSLGP